MAAEWRKLTLGEVCTKIGSGATPRGGNEAYRGGKTALIRSQNVHNNRFDSNGLVFIDDEQAAALRSVIVQEGDVLLNITGGSVARCCQVDSRVLPARVNQHVAIIRPNADILDPRFLMYWLTAPRTQAHLLALASAGATRNALTKSMIENLAIYAPTIGEQRTIAHILGTLDDKIELNRRMNETLEAMARALFKSWFVDFDPVRAKAEGRTPSGMDAETAKLFPSEFVDSELGPIPRGWESKTLSEVAELNPSRKLSKGTRAPYVEMASLPTVGHRPHEWPLREAGSGARFQNGDTLLARITPCLENGKTAFVDFLEEGQIGWGSTEYIVIAPREPLPPEWGYLLARADDFRDFATRKMEGSTGRQRVPANALAQYRVVLPPREVAARFGTIVKPLFRRMGANCAEAATLASLRDVLLPRLLSGELSVAAAERVASEVA